jgi:ribulose-bisphosphate carboxylase large chain
MMDSLSSYKFSGERFRVEYLLTGDVEQARSKAEAICLEQTIEAPYELIPEGDLGKNVIGHIEQLQPVDSNHFLATISYAVEVSGFEIPQLLNTICGNTSIKPGIRVEAVDLSDSLLDVFKGPRYGRSGLREMLGAPARPLLCSPLKPMGFSSNDLAQLAYQFALGGIDIIKDDHGLVDQPFSPFEERLELVTAAVNRANRETGNACIYVPNVTSPASRIVERARMVKSMGAGGLLIAPGLVGFDTMRDLAENDEIGLPVICHPAFLGGFVTSMDSGISHQVLFGQLVRLAGADATIYPNYGGRFTFTRETCAGIADTTATSMNHIKPIFPAPGGGMSLERIPDMRELYGDDVIFLIGGDLQKRGQDIVENCRRFRQLVSSSG